MFKKIVENLIMKNQTIVFMENSTAGHISDILTNVKDSEQVFKFCAVTYSKEYMIKFGVNERTIIEHSVNSMEVAKEMCKCIASFTEADYAVSVTGLIGEENNFGVTEDNKIFIAIYKKETNQFYLTSLSVINADKETKKNDIASFVANTLLKLM